MLLRNKQALLATDQITTGGTVSLQQNAKLVVNASSCIQFCWPVKLIFFAN
jgi:hypothetical protein